MACFTLQLASATMMMMAKTKNKIAMQQRTLLITKERSNAVIKYSKDCHLGCDNEMNRNEPKKKTG